MKRIFKNPSTILIITALAAFIYYAWNSNSWQFSFVGDEWPFYAFARQIVQLGFSVNPFNMHGVFDEHSVLGSFYQAIFLAIFGFNNFAWRLSNLILIVPITFFFFGWAKQLFSKQIALIATLILQSSFFLANYLKIGYLNPICFTVFIICLYQAERCRHKRQWINFLLLGILLGISFYLYIGPLFPLLLLPYLLYILIQKKAAGKNFGSLFIGYGILLLPAILQIGSWNQAERKTIFNHEFKNNSQILVNIFHNFLLFYKNYDYLYNHFIAGAYLDIISGLFAFAGTIIVLLNFRQKNYRLLLLLYGTVCIVLGLTSPYAYAPTTRGIFLIPFGALFAGIGLTSLMNKFLRSKGNQSGKVEKSNVGQFMGNLRFETGNLLFVIVLASIFLLNLYQSQIGVFKIAGYSGTALVIKNLQKAQQQQEKTPIILALSDQFPYNAESLMYMRQAYDLEDVPFYILRTSRLNCGNLANTTVLAFSFDEDAVAAVQQLTCPTQYKVQSEILPASIPL